MSEDKSLDLDNIKENVSWDDLAVVHKETLANIQYQMTLVDELRLQHEATMDDESKDAFTGMTLSMRDLIRETIVVGLEHATDSETVPVTPEENMTYAKAFRAGVITDNDEALDYINIGAKYYAIQDKTVSLISMGWVDLFTTLKIPASEYEAAISNTVEKEVTDVK